jgi:hypothetical protein
MENPIKQLHNGGMIYEYMAYKTRLHINTIYKLAKLTSRQAGNIPIKNAILLKSELGIDLWGYYKSDK